ncbi:MAG TPA: 50S ribosomal protein L1 [Planctomycetota bacterium]|nr:50S ribosomal protein L1 [Planctomycetota bacterium]
MKTRSKRYKKSLEGLDLAKIYQVDEAVKLLKERSKVKFDESVELAIRLNIDPKQADQLVRGTFSLPKGTGKSVKVIAFAEGQAAEDAKAAGATEVGGEELAKKVEGGWTDFDVAIAHPAMMRFVGKLGKVLGPQGKMPSPKSGTVTPDVAKAVKEFRGGKIEFRNDQFGNVHVLVGKVSFSAEDLTANASAMLEHVKAVRPAAVKGIYMAKAVLSTTMGPGLKLAI